jgi:DNA-binding NarL/FixJ family response regulator
VSRRAWAPAEDQALASLYREGTPKEEIASELGRSVGSVQSRLHAAGLLPKRPPPTPEEITGWQALKAAGVPLKEVLASTRHAAATIRRYVGRWTEPRQAWRISELRQLHAGYLAGVPLAELAARLERPITSVQRRLRGLANRRKAWTEVDSLRLELLWQQGRLIKEIAGLLDRPAATVVVYRKRLGLPNRINRIKKVVK